MKNHYSQLLVAFLFSGFLVFSLINSAHADTVIVKGAQSSTTEYNINQATHLAACFDRVKANQGNCYIALVGDSIVYGLFSDNDTSTFSGNDQPASPGQQLTSLLRAVGIPVSYNAWFGNQNGGPSVNQGGLANDGRVTIGSDWSTINGSTFTLGGRPMQETTVGGNALSFTPITPIDTCYFIYLNQGGLDIANISMNGDGGSANALLDTGAGAGSYGMLKYASLTAPRGMNTCSISDNSSPYGYGLYMAGMVGIDSTQSQVVILNMGWSGSETVNWNYNDNQTWSFINGALSQLPFQLDAVVLEGGIGNNMLYGLDTNFTATQLQAEIDAIHASGADAILTTDTPIHPGIAPYATQQQYYQIMLNQALANQTPFIDTYAALNGTYRSYATNSDGIHPNAFGYLLEADVWYRGILDMAGYTCNGGWNTNYSWDTPYPTDTSQPWNCTKVQAQAQ